MSVINNLTMTKPKIAIQIFQIIKVILINMIKIHSNFKLIKIVYRKFGTISSMIRDNIEKSVQDNNYMQLITMLLAYKLIKSRISLGDVSSCVNV